MVHYGKCKSDVLTIFIETTMHLVLPPPPPKKRGCITIVSNFSWVSREIEDNCYAKFGGRGRGGGGGDIKSNFWST